MCIFIQRLTKVFEEVFSYEYIMREISLHFVDTLSIDTTIGIMLMGFETNLKTYIEAVRHSVQVDTYPVVIKVFEQSIINYIHYRATIFNEDQPYLKS